MMVRERGHYLCSQGYESFPKSKLQLGDRASPCFFIVHGLDVARALDIILDTSGSRSNKECSCPQRIGS